ncbi:MULTISPECIES: hypothetical protein [unclassified Moorena]|uniref:hypothetical protein n=1 Tax=unclassified Moorena TaxID=2683338 RepID=UPI0013C92C4F|nr:MULTISPECIES: hypothetical protein [unclassified Moorena]NES41309.1 hypothetical protein [Moorena sp. SIO2C4]
MAYGHPTRTHRPGRIYPIAFLTSPLIEMPLAYGDATRTPKHWDYSHNHPESFRVVVTP